MINPSDNTTQNLISAPQDLTASWADLGQVIDCRDIKAFGLWLTLDINSSQDVAFRILVGDERTLATPHVLVTGTAATGKTTIVGEVFEFNSDADQAVFIPVSSLDLVPYAKVQVMAGTVGGTAGQIDAAKVSFQSK